MKLFGVLLVGDNNNTKMYIILVTKTCDTIVTPQNMASNHARKRRLAHNFYHKILAFALKHTIGDGKKLLEKYVIFKCIFVHSQKF